MIKLEAAKRITAVHADVNAAKAFLTELGFLHLSLKAENDEIIKFFYVAYDPKTVAKYLGQPKPDDNPRRLEYDFGDKGQVVIWTKIKTVTLKNSGIGALRIKPTETHVPPEVEKEGQQSPEHTPQETPNIPGSKENDDSKVPVTHISDHLIKLYANISKSESPLARKLFMKDLWNYLNTEKFGGKMKIPNLGFLKKMGPTSMRLRGRWTPYKRALDVSPRLFYATQNFFVEVFLHEMCHQAVSEIDRVIDNTEKGHGPNWQRWMVKVGLNPRRFDPNDNTTYMKPEEKKEFEQNVKQYKESKSTIDEEIKQRNLHQTAPREGIRAIARFGNPQKLVPGYILTFSTLNMEKWYFMSDTQVMEMINTKRIRWYFLPRLVFYTPDTVGVLDPNTIKTLIGIAERDRRSKRSGNV